MQIKAAITLIAFAAAVAWAGIKPPRARYPAPLTPWEARQAVTLERNIIADSMERIQSGQGNFNDYILMRFNMPSDCTDAELSEARRVLLDELRERISN